MASDEGRKAVDDLKYGSKPSDDERTQAEKAVRDRFRKELEAKGLKGDRLESALDGRMRSTEGMEAVSALADKLHDEAGITDAERDAARRAVFGKRSRELQKAGFKGGDLKRELDKYMDSDEAKAPSTTSRASTTNSASTATTSAGPRTPSAPGCAKASPPRAFPAGGWTTRSRP